MTSDGKFGQDITCARLEKIAGPMLVRLEKLQAALERIVNADYPRSVDQMQQIAKKALE